jgi:uncharacterized protein (TIGR03382 family)
LLSPRGPLIAAAAFAAAHVSCGSADGGEAVGASRAAITQGTPDTGDMGVVALLESGTLVCTATLVAPRVLLTAAHCLPEGAMPEAFFGESPQAGGTSVALLATVRHPDFDATTLTNDVAMALLADAAPTGATPSPLPTAPLGASSVGLALRLVGFGLTGPTDTTPAQKREGNTVVASLSAQQLTFTPSPSQTCSGDSGGPAFATLGGVEVLVGVTSSGDPQCDQGAIDTRVDAYESFITPFLQATAEGAAAPGQRCYYAANCAPAAGTCTPALDDPTLSFCAPPCAAGGACPAGLQCLAGDGGAPLCRHPLPSPGAQGSPCQAGPDCASGTCLAPASGGGSVCTSMCVSGVPGFCQSGSSCLAAAGDGGVTGCFAPPPASGSPPAAHGNGGCAASGGLTRPDDGSGESAALAVLGMLALRRRRRLGPA